MPLLIIIIVQTILGLINPTVNATIIIKLNV